MLTVGGTLRFWGVAAAVAALLSGLVAPAASAADAPSIVSLSVQTHVLTNQVIGHVVDWSADGGWPDGEISLSFYDANGDFAKQVSWPTDGQASGSTRLDWLGSGVLHAEYGTVSDGAGASKSYLLYEDAPLLDDVWFATFVDAPGAPSTPEITEDTLPGPGIGEIAVWCTKSDGHGLPILDYTLTATPVAGGTPVTLSRNGASRCSDVISGLTPGIDYLVTAQARTAVGSSEVSSPLREEALAGPPEAPSDLSAIAGDESVSLSWSRPESFNKTVDAYGVDVQCGGSHSDLVQVGTNVEAPTSTNISGLTNGCQGTFRVKAHTAQGWGPASEWSDTFVPTSGQAPTAVQNLGIAGSYKRAVTWWSIPTSGEPAGGYRYSIVAGRVATPGAVVETNASSAELDDLQPGEDYVFSVWAVNDFGEEGPSTSILLQGTQVALRTPTEIVAAGDPLTVRGRVSTTFDGHAVAQATVVVQRQRADSSRYRSIDVSDISGSRGRFSLDFVPRSGVAYRVALVGQSGLGGSAAAIPVATTLG